MNDKEKLFSWAVIKRLKDDFLISNLLNYKSENKTYEAEYYEDDCPGWIVSDKQNSWVEIAFITSRDSKDIRVSSFYLPFDVRFIDDFESVNIAVDYYKSEIIKQFVNNPENILALIFMLRDI